MSIKVVLVVNPKGGAGKSTLATNLAGMLAHRGLSDGSTRVMLGDLDRQQSSRGWLERRPENLATIDKLDIEAGQSPKAPRGTTHLVIDTPAGLNGADLKKLVKQASHIIIPVQPSMFDIMATHTFLQEMSAIKATHQVPMAVVGMRIDERTRAAEEFTRFVATTDIPLLTNLRDTQLYVQLAAYGMTLFDLSGNRAEHDLPQWKAIWEWV